MNEPVLQRYFTKKALLLNYHVLGLDSRQSKISSIMISICFSDKIVFNCFVTLSLSVP